MKKAGLEAPRTKWNFATTISPKKIQAPYICEEGIFEKKEVVETQYYAIHYPKESNKILI